MAMSDRMDNITHTTPRRCQAAWIPGVHPGLRGCSAEVLLEFLCAIECDHPCLAGDIIDIGRMGKRPYRARAHSDVVRAVLGKAGHGT